MASSTFHLTAAGTFTLQSAGGRTLHTVNVNKGVAGTLTLYDNPAAAGAVIAVIDTTAANDFPIDAGLNNGLTAVLSAAADVTIQLS